jgi:hypothetical protein
MQQEGLITLGTCKSRNSADAPARLTRINLLSGYIGGQEEKAETPVSSTRTMLDPSLAYLVEELSRDEAEP